MRNVHRRRCPVPAAAAGRLLDRLSSSDDALWPTPSWPAMRLDRPLGVGATGGHGPIRCSVTAYEPGRRVEFTFLPVLKLRGTHTVTVEPEGETACVVCHVLVGQPEGSLRLAWPLVFRWLHDALIEDLLDNAEEALTGRLATRARWSWWVRFLRSRMAARGRGARSRSGRRTTPAPRGAG